MDTELAAVLVEAVGAIFGEQAVARELAVARLKQRIPVEIRDAAQIRIPPRRD
ncbi:hypothetical protein [Bradyrhizobium sp. CSS354]|uniref:hypothetical protein n=1 Tax=Bradyrhizobium sp. CSS354 TaxID=2699172 RepID=UPI0023B05B50|nr:hypothetical protein [Bradyrhizobium sp. CSS354]